jgi:hypothetical protein
MANSFLLNLKNPFIGFASPFLFFMCRQVAKIRPPPQKKKETLIRFENIYTWEQWLVEANQGNKKRQGETQIWSNLVLIWVSVPPFLTPVYFFHYSRPLYDQIGDVSVVFSLHSYTSSFEASCKLCSCTWIYILRFSFLRRRRLLLQQEDGGVT